MSLRDLCWNHAAIPTVHGRLQRWEPSAQETEWFLSRDPELPEPSPGAAAQPQTVLQVKQRSHLCSLISVFESQQGRVDYGCAWLWLTMQGPAAGGETRAEASVGAAQTGAAQRGGDGTTAPLRSGDGASQEAAKAGGGQWHQKKKKNSEKFLV